MAKIIISLPDELLAKVDAFCAAKDYNRSEFIRFSLRSKIEAEVRKFKGNKNVDVKPIQE